MIVNYVHVFYHILVASWPHGHFWLNQQAVQPARKPRWSVVAFEEDVLHGYLSRI
jgi:hypothetical protein